MATGVTSWSTIASNNATADANINWAEGMAPSQVNDSARAMMSSVALYRNDNSEGLLTTGSSAAYSVTSFQGFASIAALVGQTFAITFQNNNSSGATLSVDGLTPLVLTSGNGTSLSTGAIQAGQVWNVTCQTTSAFIVRGIMTTVNQVSDGFSLTSTNQTLTGGFITQTFNNGTVSSGTFTPNPLNGPLQALTNNGAFTMAAPTNQGEITMLVVNGGSAGTITFSGFSVGSNKGDSLDTVNGHSFFIKIYLISATAGYHIQACQ